jgi:hypothetical protein
MRFDWYSATVPAPLQTVLGALRTFFPYGCEEPVRALPRYDDAVESAFGEERLFRLDGQTEKKCTLITASSDTCPMVVAAIRQVWNDHNVSRIDACQDFTGDTVFEDMDALLVNVALTQGIRLDQAGDWFRKDGRTRYIGARSSISMIRLYEKGWEQYAKAKAGQHGLPDDFDITRTRLETQLRPPSRDKLSASKYTPDDVAAYADWTKWAHTLMLGFELAAPLKAERKRSPHDRKMLHLAKQYGLTLKAELARCGGSLEDLGRSLIDRVDQVEELARRCVAIPKDKL